MCAESKKKPIRLHDTLQAAQDKLLQQIDEGEALRTLDVNSWTQLEELKSERRIWTEYTAEVLKALLGKIEYAGDFVLAATPVDLRSGDLAKFEFVEKTAILEGVTFLRSLRRRLPHISDKGSKPETEAARVNRKNIRDPRAKTTIVLLEHVNPELANSYKQILRDIQDVTDLTDVLYQAE